MRLILTLLLVALLASGNTLVVVHGFDRSTQSSAMGSESFLIGAPTNISYLSSVDGLPLSYLEYLPMGFQGGRSYPLAAYLHGAGNAIGENISGGVGGGVIPAGLVANASSSGYILISLNTRTSDAFYVNTPCGGPQQQDVVNAIAHESGIRSIDRLYLIGFSAGSNGVLSLAGHGLAHPAGIATAGTITDFFETFAYNIANNGTGRYRAFVAGECGVGVGPSNQSVVRTVTYMSVFRFHPENFSGIKLFIAAGGQDTVAPNNATNWPFSNANSTLLTATSNIASIMGESANTTRPYYNLSQNDLLFLYDPLAPHDSTQIAFGEMFKFWAGTVSSGLYTSTYPARILTPATLTWLTGTDGGDGSNGGPLGSGPFGGISSNTIYLILLAVVVGSMTVWIVRRFRTRRPGP